MDLLALVDFNLVATNGGFGRASRASGRPKATLSRRVMELEVALGVRLLERGPRSLRLTEEGSRLYARTQGLLREIAEAGEAISAGVEQPRGSLRVSAPVLLAHVALGRIGASFANRYPDVRLDITAEDRLADPVEDGFDLVIRINPTPDDRLVGRRFLKDELVVVAPSGMVRPSLTAPKPATMRAVTLTRTPTDIVWTVMKAGQTSRYRPDPVLRVSSLLMVRDAVLAGGGAALLPHFLVADDVAAGLLEVWGAAVDQPVEIWALHPSRRLVSSKVAAFMQCLVEGFPERRIDSPSPSEPGESSRPRTRR